MQNLNEVGIKKRVDPLQAQVQTQEQFHTKCKLPTTGLIFFFYLPGNFFVNLTNLECWHVAVFHLFSLSLSCEVLRLCVKNSAMNSHNRSWLFWLITPEKYKNICVSLQTFQTSNLWHENTLEILQVDLFKERKKNVICSKLNTSIWAILKPWRYFRENCLPFCLSKLIYFLHLSNVSC